MNADLLHTIQISVYNNEDKRVSFSSRSSFNPQQDTNTMYAAVELVQAVLLRGIDITPAEMYEHLVGRKHVAPKKQETQTFQALPLWAFFRFFPHGALLVKNGKRTFTTAPWGQSAIFVENVDQEVFIQKS